MSVGSLDTTVPAGSIDPAPPPIPPPGGGGGPIDRDSSEKLVDKDKPASATWYVYRDACVPGKGDLRLALSPQDQCYRVTGPPAMLRWLDETGCARTGALSVASRVTLGSQARKTFGIPLEAAYYTYLYPPPVSRVQTAAAPVSNAAQLLMSIGGFAYFAAAMDVPGQLHAAAAVDAGRASPEQPTGVSPPRGSPPPSPRAGGARRCSTPPGRRPGGGRRKSVPAAAACLPPKTGLQVSPAFGSGDTSNRPSPMQPSLLVPGGVPRGISDMSAVSAASAGGPMIPIAASQLGMMRYVSHDVTPLAVTGKGVRVGAFLTANALSADVLPGKEKVPRFNVGAEGTVPPQLAQQLIEVGALQRTRSKRRISLGVHWWAWLSAAANLGGDPPTPSGAMCYVYCEPGALPSTGTFKYYPFLPDRTEQTKDASPSAARPEGEAGQPAPKMGARSQPVSKRFKRMEKIGQGAFGVVFRGIDRASGEHVAMKVFPVKMSQTEQLKQIQTEHDLMAHLAHHNLVQIHAFEISKQEATLVMEMVSGGDLRKYIRDTSNSDPKGLGLPLISRFLHGIVDAVQYLHGQNLVHRDLKPENVLCSVSGSVKVVDFGAAQTVATAAPSAPHDTQITKQTSTGVGKKKKIGKERQGPAWQGTPRYSSPESLMGGQGSFPQDVWAIGLIALEMRTTEPPWPDLPPSTNLPKVMFHISESTEDYNVPSGLTPLLRDFATACLRRDPHERLTCHALLYDKLLCTPPDELHDLDDRQSDVDDEDAEEKEEKDSDESGSGGWSESGSGGGWSSDLMGTEDLEEGGHIECAGEEFDTVEVPTGLEEGDAEEEEANGCRSATEAQLLPEDGGPSTTCTSMVSVDKTTSQASVPPGPGPEHHGPTPAMGGRRGTSGPREAHRGSRASNSREHRPSDPKRVSIAGESDGKPRRRRRGSGESDGPRESDVDYIRSSGLARVVEGLVVGALRDRPQSRADVLSHIQKNCHDLLLKDPSWRPGDVGPQESWS